LGRLNWLVASVATLREETPQARTLVLDVPDWPGHVAGQHVDVRLTAADGYSTARSYSIANAADGKRVELTVVRIPEGEVSPYLTEEIGVRDLVEIRGPIGGWFVWQPVQTESVQLIAGGSGLVPLMAMIRTRVAVRHRAPFRLLYSVRDPESVLYAAELQDIVAQVPVTYAYTRRVPNGSMERPHRVDAATLASATWPAASAPTCYVCGPTAFVEVAADLLRSAGHEPARIRTERFGPSGGSP